jgi:hypothetical protein
MTSFLNLSPRKFNNKHISTQFAVAVPTKAASMMQQAAVMKRISNTATVMAYDGVN